MESTMSSTKSKKQQVEILHIRDPFNFWISESPSKRFLELIHSEISQNMTIIQLFEETENELFGIKKPHEPMLYRARIITHDKTKLNVTCYLIDTGETVCIRLNECRKILNKKLQEVPPLAKYCKLDGIQPGRNSVYLDLNDNERMESWTESTNRFLHEVLKDKKCNYYLEYIRMTKTKSKPNKVKLYIKSQQDNTVQCLNDLLINKKYAIATHDEKNYLNINDNETGKGLRCSTPVTATSTENENEHDIGLVESTDDNIDNLKQFLKSKYGGDKKKQEYIEDLFSDGEPLKKPSSPLSSEPKKVLDNLPIARKVKRSDNSNVFVYGANLSPMLQNTAIHELVRVFLHKQGINDVSEYESYLWPCIMRGHHLLAVDSDTHKSSKIGAKKDKYLTSLAPLLTLLLNDVEGNFKEDKLLAKCVSKPTNGPILMIVCSSCRNAQRVFEIVMGILQEKKRLLRVIILQGGGKDESYDVKLANGCDLLICATPYVLLRMIGYAKTNLKRLKYFVLDDADVLLDKYPKQIHALMDNYTNLLKADSTQLIAQLLLFSQTWTNRIRKFINLYFMDETIIFTSKLEASYFGNVNHVITECGSLHDKLARLGEIIKSLSSSTKNNKTNNIVVFVQTHELAGKIHSFLKNKAIPSSLIDENTNSMNINKRVDDWISQARNNFASTKIPDSILNENILICTDKIINFVNIRNANCVINFDFPHTKDLFSQRLWYMRDNFKFMRNHNSSSKRKDEEFTDFEVQENDGDGKDSFECQSYILLTEDEYKYSQGLLNFLLRVGVDEASLPRLLVQMANEIKMSKESSKIKKPLCPFVKSYGKCVSPLKNCDYRHFLNMNEDELRELSRGEAGKLCVPNEGFVKFKVSHVEETNHFYINIISNEIKQKDGTLKSIDYNQFNEFDFNLQFYYSNSDNAKSVTEFNKRTLYAYKDPVTTIFKRVKLQEAIDHDSNVVYRIKVKLIDYGETQVIDTRELLELPEAFSHLPSQAVEVYACNIRPIDRDLNWSVTSKLFLTDRLDKSKVFYGRIQLAVGNTLWLQPISSVKKLDALNMNVIDDYIRVDLTQNHFAVSYEQHLVELKKLFTEARIPVCEEIEESRGIKNEKLIYKTTKPDYAFLDSTNPSSIVLVSAVDTPTSIFIQNKKFYNLLLDLNIEIQKHLEENLNADEFLKRKAILIAMLKNPRKHKAELKFCYCLAKFSLDNEYCRAQIVEINSRQNRVRIFFVDYGDYDYANMDDLYPLDDRFIQKLPFQAIKCTMNCIRPIDDDGDQKKWGCDIGDLIWSLTHDEFHFDCSVCVREELATEYSFQAFKFYSVDLFEYTMPLQVNISYKIFSAHMALFTEAEEASLVLSTCCSNDSSVQNNSASKWFKEFLRLTDSEKQLESINRLKSKFAILIRCGDLKKTGVIQMLSKILCLLSDEKCILAVVENIRKFFLNKEEFIQIFCENDGLANVLRVMCECVNKNLNIYNSLFDVLDHLVRKSRFAKEMIMKKSGYHRSIWFLLRHSRNENEIFELIEILDILFMMDNFEYMLSSYDYDFIAKIASKVVSNYNIDKVLDLICRLEEIVEQRQKNEEVFEKAVTVGMQTLHKLEQTVKKDDTKTEDTIPRINENFLNDFHGQSDIDSNDSSFLECNDKFELDLMAMFRKPEPSNRPNAIKSNPEDATNQWRTQEYSYPKKIIWNQTLDFIKIKVLLKNAKNIDVIFETKHISFRSCVDNVTYGFDFQLFSGIVSEKSFAVTEADYVNIDLKKEADMMWSRLLNTTNKPRFLVCRYDNIDTTSDEEDEEYYKLARKELKKIYEDEEHISKQNKKKRVKINKNLKNEESCSLESDSESEVNSDFNDDVKEDKDIFWD